MRALYLVSKCLPRVRMGGSDFVVGAVGMAQSAPRVHGWFQAATEDSVDLHVCPACAWVVPLDS